MDAFDQVFDSFKERFSQKSKRVFQSVSFEFWSLLWKTVIFWNVLHTAVKFNIKVNNALTQIHFNGTHFINAWLTQRIFSVWPVTQPIFGEMEMHSAANVATLQTPLVTFLHKKKPKR